MIDILALVACHLEGSLRNIFQKIDIILILKNLYL